MSTRFSPDGAFWWDGSSWQLAVSPDGLWRWNGSHWVPNWPAAAAPGTAPPAGEPTAPNAVPSTPAQPPLSAGPEALPPSPALGPPQTQASDPVTQPSWEPVRPARQPTAWTRPLQVGSALYLLVTALFSVVVVPVLFAQSGNLERQVATTYAAAGVSADDAHTAVQLALGVGAALALVFAAFYALLAVGGLRGWPWVHIADLVVCALAAIGAISGVTSLAGPSPLPRFLLAASLPLDLAGVALGLLLLVALLRWGIWASPRPRPAAAASALV